MAICAVGVWPEQARFASVEDGSKCNRTMAIGGRTGEEGSPWGLRDERLRAVIICPSNPFISIEPILAVTGMRQALSACAAPVVAVSPIIGGSAVKGPTAKMMGELGIKPNAAAVAKLYGDLLDGYVMDIGDAEEVANVAPRVTLAPTLMTNLAEREELARIVLEAADALASVKRGRDFVE